MSILDIRLRKILHLQLPLI